MAVFLHYYQDLFATSNPTDQSLTLDHIPRVITKEMEQMLKGEFLEHEVTIALKQMAPATHSTWSRWDAFTILSTFLLNGGSSCD